MGVSYNHRICMSDFKDRLKETFSEEFGKYFGVGVLVASFAYLGMNVIDPQGDIDAVKQLRAEAKQKASRKSRFIEDDTNIEFGKSKEGFEESLRRQVNDKIDDNPVFAFSRNNSDNDSGSRW